VSRNTRLNIQTALVLGGALAAWIFVPGEVLLPLSWGLLALGVGGVFAIKAYLQRLHAADARIESGEDLQAIQAIRDRKDLATQAAMALATAGFAAFLVLLLEHA
jgi:hypothetical protein